MKTNALFYGLLAAVLAISAPAFAQTTSPRRVSAADALERLRTETLAATPGGRGGVNAVARILSREHAYPAATVDSLLDGLENMAVDGSSRVLASAAAVWLSDAGRMLGPRGAAVLPRLIRTYERSPDPVVRLLIVQGMARQPPSGEITRFLERVAMSHGPQEGHSPDEPWYAVATLAQMGEPGRTALVRMHRNQSVRDGKAKGYLDHLAQRHFVSTEPN